MTANETEKLLARIQSVFNIKMNDNTIDMWNELLEEYPYFPVYNALINYMKTESKSPKPADLLARIDPSQKFEREKKEKVYCRICNGDGYIIVRDGIYSTVYNCTCKNEHIINAKNFIEAEIDLGTRDSLGYYYIKKENSNE